MRRRRHALPPPAKKAKVLRLWVVTTLNGHPLITTLSETAKGARGYYSQWFGPWKEAYRDGKRCRPVELRPRRP